ncbi:uncharacterized protein LOC127251742 [Andrographis paniculata]|uniref:uncharacterized protein LOC127251742 n=1 Tax=Andrographis paniculata TaxID=175694 RepID=UPI0021E75818|nr:uncharacterized protein LOC127251742 [Andrographis paniculata]
MFAKRLFQKGGHRHLHQEKGLLTPDDFNLRVNVHYGIPSTASILAFDPIQRLLAIGTLDGRIKVIGGDNVEGLLISPKVSPFKHLEFLQNQGFLISITNDNDIQVWNLEKRSIDCSLQWESNVTAFSVISGSSFMYVGDEYGMMSVLKYDPECEELLRLQYQLSSDSLAESVGSSISNRQPIVGILPQPCSSWNRLLITYESGLVILWDVVEAKVIVVRGNKDLHLEKRVVPPSDAEMNIVNDAPSRDGEKEISALCWVSSNGSVLAVGYVDGDILFWDTSHNSSNEDEEDALSPNVVQLQLSSAEKRLPVIVLHWLDQCKYSKQKKGQLILYGGDEIGCDEVVTVLTLEWSAGMQTMRCIDRVDLNLSGSFADMILIPSVGATGSDTNASLFVLSSPGQIQIYDTNSFPSSNLQSRKVLPVSAINFPASISTVHPLLTVSELFLVYDSIEALGSETAVVNSTPTLPGNRKWPVTGGISNHATFEKDDNVHKLFVAGYQDGSVRIWNATNPVFRLLCVLTNEVNGKRLVDSGASLTTIDLCFSTFTLAVGSECGLVLLYHLCSSGDGSFHFVTEITSEVHNSAPVQGPRCRAAFKLQKSGVRTLNFVRDGCRLIVGYECSRVAVLDARSLSVEFITDAISSSPLISVTWKGFISGIDKSSDETASKTPANSTGELIFVTTKDASVYAIDGKSGSMISTKPMQLKKNSTPISLYVIENWETVHRSLDVQLPKDGTPRNELSQNDSQGSDEHETQESPITSTPSAHSLKELLVVLCSTDVLHIYSAKSVVQGESKYIHKVKLPKPCCWTSLFKKDTEVCGLVLLYQTGDMEIRSLPDLDLVRDLSPLSELRWNFKTNMDRMTSSTENGHIVLVNGSEVAVISLLESENDFRIPESLPHLHDEVLAAAANAAISVSSYPKRKEGSNTGLLGGIVKGFKGWKSKSNPASPSKSSLNNLDDIFKKNPFSEPSTATIDEHEVELSIDDIEIDDPEPLPSTSSQEVNNSDRDEKSQRERLFGNDDDITPRLRTREEIIAKYRKAADASSAAGQARDKLLERQEKLERISRRTEDLRHGAEDFASLANELVKAMEKRKWYHI